MAPPPPTVLALKQAFLANQTRLLSQELAPSRSWSNANAAADDGLPEKAVDDALFRLNHTVQQHSRRVHAPQATRHVAEQIDQLYWNAGERAAAAGHEKDSADSLNLGLDLTNLEAIVSLPPAWDSEHDVEAQPMEARRYVDLTTQLQSLAERRREAIERVTRLRRMRDTLAPFEPPASSEGGRDAGHGSVQENLVTRSGEVEKELERMRVLLARVGGRVGHLRELDGGVVTGAAAADMGTLFRDGDSMEVDDVEMEERRKIEALLGDF